MRKLFLALLAASLFVSARAGDESKSEAEAADGAAPATEGKPAKQEKDAERTGTEGDHRKKARGKTQKKKPCEPVRPCPID
jgi:hypothetical protein